MLARKRTTINRCSTEGTHFIIDLSKGRPLDRAGSQIGGREMWRCRMTGMVLLQRMNITAGAENLSLHPEGKKAGRVLMRITALQIREKTGLEQR